MNRTAIDDANFTINAWESLYSAVDDKYFRDKDAALIYKALSEKLKFISFGEYLKRYIYRKAGMTDAYESVEIKEYQDIIKENFYENHTPQSFTLTTAKLSALSKNWLTQQTVKRGVVFLLGFGLAMSVEDVNDFLKKALRERGINAKDPFEVICWYCYKNRYNYLKFEKLWKAYLDMPSEAVDVGLLYGERTIGVRDVMFRITDEASLMEMLSKLKGKGNELQFSVSAKAHFDMLYDKTRDIIAGLYNQTESEENSMEMEEYRIRLENSDRLSDEEKLQRMSRKKEQRKKYQRQDITEADIEKIICSAVPVDRHGNLTPGKYSRLNAQFDGKRFSRQRIQEILNGKAGVTRFDLITLNFFIFSQELDQYKNTKERYVKFIESTNQILEDCSLGSLYIVNPYECFVLMCILSEAPMSTYADVIELSFDGCEL